jgi:UPF0042 nucleotide-binding protein
MNAARRTHDPAVPRARVVLVTGMSGAGKTTALKAFEDMNFEAVDNMPLTLLENLVFRHQPDFAGAEFTRPIAIGVDVRTRDFDAASFLAHYDKLAQGGEVDARILFIDCEDEELRRRYEETRHRHPLAADRPIADGIEHERRLVSPLRERADLVVDTTGLAPGELKRVLGGHFAETSAPDLAIFVTSFSYRRGLPRDADLVFDVRFLANPHYEADLRRLSGEDGAVGAFIDGDPAFAPFFQNLTGLLSPLLPSYKAEGKSYLTIAVGCTGGRHRSVFVARRLAKWFEGQGERVRLHHRDLGATE